MSNKTVITIVIVAVLVVAGGVALFLPKGGPLPASGDVGNAALRDLQRSGVRLIDVRTSAEYAGGHLEGAENVPVESITTAAAGWKKTQPIVLYCQTGARSANAYGYLVAQGFTNVYNLKDGIVAWDGAVVRGETSSSAKMPATTLPTLYDFSSDT